MHSMESRFVIRHEVYCLMVCICALLSPEILQIEALKGLRVGLKGRSERWWECEVAGGRDVDLGERERERICGTRKG